MGDGTGAAFALFWCTMRRMLRGQLNFSKGVNCGERTVRRSRENDRLLSPRSSQGLDRGRGGAERRRGWIARRGRCGAQASHRFDVLEECRLHVRLLRRQGQHRQALLPGDILPILQSRRLFMSHGRDGLHLYGAARSGESGSGGASLRAMLRSYLLWPWDRLRRPLILSDSRVSGAGWRGVFLICQWVFRR